jgi:hypothetical protein
MGEHRDPPPGPPEAGDGDWCAPWEPGAEPVDPLGRCAGLGDPFGWGAGPAPRWEDELAGDDWPPGPELPGWRELAPGVQVPAHATAPRIWPASVAGGHLRESEFGATAPGEAGTGRSALARPRRRSLGARARVRPVALALGTLLLGAVLVPAAVVVARPPEGRAAPVVEAMAPLEGTAGSDAADAGDTLPPAAAPSDDAAPLDRDGASAPQPSPTAVVSGEAPLEPPATAAGSPDWWSVLERLDRQRAAALAATDPALLPVYAVPGSPAWDADARLIDDLVAAGLAPVGLAVTLVAIEAIEAVEAVEAIEAIEAIEAAAEASQDGPDLAEPGADGPSDPSPTVDPAPSGEPAASGPDALAGEVPAVRLTVVDRRSAYRLVDPAGRAVHEEPAGTERRWRLTMVRWPGDSAGEGLAATDPRDPTAQGPGADGHRGAGWRLHRVEAVP